MDYKIVRIVTLVFDYILAGFTLLALIGLWGSGTLSTSTLVLLFLLIVTSVLNITYVTVIKER